jgi:putative peptidoglycan lipid II flippase
MGFLRDILIAAFFGSGPVAEAFQVAFALPNMFRRFFAEGAFNMAFIPIFSKKLESYEIARKFAQNSMAGLASVLIAFNINRPTFHALVCARHGIWLSGR